MSNAKRYFIFDRSKVEAQGLATYNSIRGQKYMIVDRETNLPVDDASTMYEARQAVKAWNAGDYDN